LSAAKRRGGEEPEQYEPDATWGYMENASLNTGVKCKSDTCTVFHNVKQLQTRQLFTHLTYIYIYRKTFRLTVLVTRREDQKDNFIFCLNYEYFIFLYLILSVSFFPN
jgi:hypothetical protein